MAKQKTTLLGARQRQDKGDTDITAISHYAAPLSPHLLSLPDGLIAGHSHALEGRQHIQDRCQLVA